MFWQELCDQYYTMEFDFTVPNFFGMRSYHGSAGG